MAYTLAQLQTFFTNANAGTAPTAAQLNGLQGIANQNATGALTDAAALQSAIDLGSDVTTAVSVQTYQFFLGFAPSVAGLTALNAAYVGSGAQAGANGENRYIAQSVSLALDNPTAKASFAAAYGSLSIADATKAAYNVIVGNTAAAAAGINVDAAVAFLTSTASVAYYEAFVKANVPGLAAADVALAVKAALVGEIIYQATIFNNGAGVGSYAKAANNLVKDLADDGALTANNAAGINLFTAYGVPTAPQTEALSVSATDTVVTGAGADTIIGQWGQTTTLQASDKIDGGAGVDTLRIVTDVIPGQATAATVAGFTVSNVEVLEIQAQNANGTTLGLENVTGVTTIRSSASNSALVLDNVKAIANLEIVNALNAANVRVNYTAATVAGTADTQNLALNGNNAGTLQVDGVETLAITTATADSTVANIIDAQLTKITVAGDKALSVTAALANTVTTVDASAQTAGGITVTAGNAAVAVTGGAGADKVTFTAGEFTSADAYNGGAGRDTVVVALADLTAAAAAKLSNVEIVELSTALTTDFDTSRVTGEDTYALNQGFTGPVTLTKVTDGSTISVKAASTGTLTASVGDGATLATVANTANTLNLAVGLAGSNAGVNAGTIAAAGIETLTLASNGSATAGGTNTVTIVGADATKLTVTGNEGVNLTLTGTALSTLDASASTGANDFSLVTYKAATSATITGGSGVDKINGSAAADTINGGAGADVILGGGGADALTGGAGADTFTYNLVSDSSGAAQDTISDFVSGTDLINLQNLAAATGRTTVELRAGDAATFGAAQSSILQNSGKTQVVFQADTNTLWVDLNDDGTLNNNDLAIKLTGVTKIVAADIGGTAVTGGGAIVALQASGANVNTTTNTSASNKTTDFDDTISSTYLNLANSTVNGALGTDSLTVSDNAAALTSLTTAGGSGAAVTNVENITFAAVDGVMNLGANLGAGVKSLTVNGANAGLTVTGTAADQSITVNTSGTNVSTITLGAFDNQTVTTGAAGDTFNTIAQDKITISSGAGNDTFNVTNIAAFDNDSNLLTLNGGTGTDSLVLGAGLTANIDFTDTNDISITSIETLNVGAIGATSAVTIGAVGWTSLTADTTNAAVTFTGTGAQLSAVTTFTNTNGTNTFNLTVSDNGATLDLVGDTIAGTAPDIDVITFGTGTNVLKIDATNIAKVTGTVAAAGGTDTLELSNTANVADTKFNAFETLQAGGTAALDIADLGLGVARTIVGNSANNLIDIGVATAAKTINLTSGGVDTVRGSQASTGVATITGFTAGAGAGADVFDIRNADGTAAAITTTVGVVVAGATATSANTNATNAYVLSGASFQISGALTATGDAGAVEAAIINANLVGTAAGQKVLVVLDNGTDTGIYLVTTAGAVSTGLDTAGEFSVSLVGVLSGVADSGTLAAGNLI